MSMSVVIYLPDNTGHQFDIPNGNYTTTSQYLQLMIATLKLPDSLAKKSFALWLKSPLLDVQLKPQHVPFRMVKQWPMLLEKYSMATDYEKAQDEPALIFRRNAFLTKEDEVQITNEAILNILMMEAKSCIQQGIYPCDTEDIEQLGALLCLGKDEEHKQDEDKHGMESVVKENLPTLVPSHMARAKRSFLNRQQSMEERVMVCLKKASKESSINCTLEFMKICWQLPYYGSVIFSGFVEKASHSTFSLWFSSQTQMCVLIAINTNGVWVIDKEKKHVLIGLLYDDFNWEMTTPEPNEDGLNADTELQLPSLFLEFDDEKTKTNQLLQIVSKQAPMMDSMIETCILMIREKEQIAQAQNMASSGDESNGLKSKANAITSASTTRVRPLFERQNSVTSSHPEKLILTKMSDSVEDDIINEFTCITGTGRKQRHYRPLKSI
ncbi:putative FERM domain-containing protein FRMD8P1 isoform X2 [Clavelina lepadiformis]|uniref:putative FERM domain-containing protein FRMD8P1 isoform X2 n=1 Tax=Clavelina lepadiformis TaxID=159417 RepID=UPI0040428B34